MILYLTHGNGEESIPLELPAASSQVEEIDIRLDDICSGEGNFRISDVKSSVKGLWQFIRSADLLDPEDLEKLNRLSRQIDTMSEKEHQIFAGALLSECISNLNDVLQTVERIGQYGMIPKVTCDRKLGGYLVEHGKIDCPEHLKPYLDYVGIGAEFYSNCGGAYTLDGYSKKFLAEHESEITIHKAAKNYFDGLGFKKLPTIKALNTEYAELLAEKKAAYADYRKAREEMKELLTSKANIDRILELDKEQEEANERREKEAEQR